MAKHTTTGARYIARQNGTMNNKYADDIKTEGKNSELVRVSNTVVKRRK